MWKRKFFLKNNNKKNTKHFIFVVVVCLFVLVSKIDFKTLQKKVRKKNHLNPITVFGQRQWRMDALVVRDLRTCDKRLC